MPRIRLEPNSALEQILAQDQANGVDVFDDRGAPQPAPGPPMLLQPLYPLAFEKPDWRAEEEAAIAAEKARKAEALKAEARKAEPDPEPPPPESLDSRPAKPRRKSSTPRLDAVRAWMDGR